MGSIRQHSDGFTLVELLVVVAIIAILAAIAVPNFLDAQTRSKVARMQADMRSLDTALASYQTDYNEALRRRSDDGNTALGISPSPTAYYPCWQDRLFHYNPLTTPIMYISSIPKDVFESQLPDPMFRLVDYLDPVQTARFIERARFAGHVDPAGYVILSVGPDGVMGHTIAEYGSFCPDPYPRETTSRGSFKYFYDPTNGTASYGNLYRFNGWPDDESVLRP